MGLRVKNLESLDAQTTMRIRFMIKNRQGLGGGLYVPNDAFHTLVKEQVGRTGTTAVPQGSPTCNSNHHQHQMN